MEMVRFFEGRPFANERPPPHRRSFVLRILEISDSEIDVPTNSVPLMAPVRKNPVGLAHLLEDASIVRHRPLHADVHLSAISEAAIVEVGERVGPLRDLQDLGGWKTSATLLTVYLRADEGAQREALEQAIAAPSKASNLQ
jgi:hypothetical protein